MRFANEMSIRFIHKQVRTHDFRNDCCKACCPTLPLAKPISRRKDNIMSPGRVTGDCSEDVTHPISLHNSSVVDCSFPFFVDFDKIEGVLERVFYSSQELHTHVSQNLNDIGHIDVLLLSQLKVSSINEKSVGWTMLKIRNELLDGSLQHVSQFNYHFIRANVYYVPRSNGGGDMIDRLLLLRLIRSPFMAILGPLGRSVWDLVIVCISYRDTSQEIKLLKVRVNIFKDFAHNGIQCICWTGRCVGWRWTVTCRSVGFEHS
mmetsp:Transcript_56501/g.120006  ORF Transcript_56501/g.120006 Transcript_56501/m.120006 type:complete len:261 (-) Transcript_56501:825-1607(-)